MAARRRRQSDDQYVRAVRRARTRGERIQAGALRVAFRLQAIRVARRLVDEGGSLQLAFDGTSRGLITRAMLDSPQATARVVADIAGVFIGLDDPLPANSPILTSLRRIGARRITMVNRATQRAARRHIVLGVRERLGTYELAYGGTERAREVARRTGWRPIRQVVQETYARRAEAIATTEQSLSAQHGTHGRIREAGLTHVRIADGAECGWLRHEDPDKANGTVRTIEAAEAQPLAHPRCRRTSIPLTARRLAAIRARR